MNFSHLIAQLPAVAFKSASEFADLHGGFHPLNLNAGIMALPDSTQQVSELLAECNRSGIDVVTHGGLTGLSGAASSNPDQLILDTRKLNQCIDIDEISATAVVDCGVTLERVEAAASQAGLSCGIDLAARGSATIGGMVSTNAGGIEAFRNGVMRHRVLGLEVVLADGRVVSDLKRVVKANEGYDLKQLFIGAEGTLGVITKVSLALMPLISRTTTALVSCATVADAVASFRAIKTNPTLTLLSAEIMWPDFARTVASVIERHATLDFEPSTSALFVIFEVQDESDATAHAFENQLGELIEANSVMNAVIARNEQQRNDIWRIREDSFVIDDTIPNGLWFDMSLPLNELANYASQLFTKIEAISPALRLFLMGHLGDGNLHATITTGQPIDALADTITAAVYEGITETGGSFSAEHGIGIDKRRALREHVSNDSLNVMQDIKTLLDPRNIMNPHKIL